MVNPHLVTYCKLAGLKLQTSCFHLIDILRHRNVTNIVEKHALPDTVKFIRPTTIGGGIYGHYKNGKIHATVIDKSGYCINTKEKAPSSSEPRFLKIEA